MNDPGLNEALRCVGEGLKALGRGLELHNLSADDRSMIEERERSERELKRSDPAARLRDGLRELADAWNGWRIKADWEQPQAARFLRAMNALGIVRHDQTAEK